MNLFSKKVSKLVRGLDYLPHIKRNTKLFLTTYTCIPKDEWDISQLPKTAQAAFANGKTTN